MKIIKYPLFFAFLILFVACGDDNKPSGDPDDYRMGYITDYDVNLRVKVTDPDALKDVATLTVRYYDANGNMQKETVTGSEWNKNVKYHVTGDLKIGLRADWHLLEPEAILAAAKTAYDLGVDITSLYTGTRTNGDKVESTFFSKQNVGTTAGAITKEALSTMTDPKIYSSFLFIFHKLSDGTIFSEEGNFPEE